MEKSLLAALKEVPWDLAETSEQLLACIPKDSPRGRVMPYRNLVAEVDDTELLLIAAGEEPDHLRERIASLKFPEPRTDSNETQ